MKDEKIVEEPFTKVFQKIGITGVASSIMTLAFGVFVIWYDLEWVQLKYIVGLYLVVIGTINLTGHLISIITRIKGQKTYIETEVFAPSFKEAETPAPPSSEEPLEPRPDD